MNLETIVTWLLPRPRPGNVLSDAERRTLAAAADVLLEDVDFAAPHEDVARNVERFIGASRRAWRVRALLAFVELAPLAGGRPRFSRASRAERARMLREGAPAGARSLFRRVRPLVVLGTVLTILLSLAVD